jgi:chromosomal replication initiation ATPase DnaA
VDIPELRAERVVPTIDALVAAVCRRFDVDTQTIWHKTRGRGARSPARAVTMYLCQRIGNMTLSQIADTFDLASYASAGSTIRSVRKRMEERPTLKEHVDYILLDLTA